MRLNEFVHGPTNTPESNLTTALELIQHRYKDQNQTPKISTQSLINLVLNTDRTFDYDALLKASKNNPAVKNLIKSVDQNSVELYPADQGADDETFNPDADPNAPVDTVANMAKRAAKSRGAAF